MSSQSETTETVGKRIRMIRGKRSQQEFARLLGVGRTTIIRYEADERLPDAEFLIKLNVLFGIQPLWVLLGNGPNVIGETLEPEERQLLELYRALPKTAKLKVDGYVEALADAARGPRKRPATDPTGEGS